MTSLRVFARAAIGAAIGMIAGFWAAPAGAEELRAGFGVSDISPDTTQFQVPLGGYGERESKPALGIHDRTLAKAIILEQGTKKFAFVALDLLGSTRSLREEVLKQIEGTGIGSDNLMLAASHTHGSLEMNTMHRGNKFNNKFIGIFDEKLLAFTAGKVAEAIKQANEKIAPVKAGVGSIAIPGMNRNRRGDKTTDDEMTILKFDTMDGETAAVLVNYTAHPTFMGGKDFYLSADWPGYLQRNLEAFLPGTLAMYCNGAEGDQAPNGGDGPSAYARAEDYGRKVAVKALELIPKIETKADAKLDYSMQMLKLPPRKVPPGLADAAGPEYGLTPENLVELLDSMQPADTYLPVLKVGDFIGVGISGEMIAALGLEIKNALRAQGAKNPVIVGLANEWISYILSPEEYGQGGYEPGVSFYGETLGPVMVEAAIKAGTAMAKKN